MAYPTQSSPLITVENEVHIVDRWNNKIRDISTLVEAVDFDIDIDRSASKVDATITAYREVVFDGDWVAIYQKITPETGPIQRDQRGHVRINTPSAEISGDGKVRTIGSGGDIIDELNDVLLDRAFVTPIDGNIMEDVRFLIRLGTIGVRGQNLVPNHSFEVPTPGWSIARADSVAFTTLVVSEVVPHGSNYMSVTFDANAPAGSYGLVSSPVMDVLPVWIGNQGLWASAMIFRVTQHSVTFYVRFFDEAGTPIYPSDFEHAYMPPAPRTSYGWERVSFWVGGIPANAVSMGIVAGFGITEPYPGPSRSIIDNVFLGTSVGTPLPDDRIDLPLVGTEVVSEVIRHPPGTSILEAINDRLQAIGYHPLYTKMDGTVTTRKNGSIYADEPARIYESSSDIRFSDVILVERSAQNRYNRVVAIKESLEEDVEPMVAIAENTNSYDPWSIYQSPQKTIEITVQDVETMEELELAAQEELAKAMEQEEIRFRITPDSSLSIHDIIQINGFEDDRAVGRWAVRSIRYGINDYDPTMEVVARRNTKAVSIG